MSRLLVIGCGGVASVAIRKCCQNSDVFTEIMIASRTKEKCDALKEKIESTTKTKIETAKVDADNAAEVAELIRAYKPDAVLNVALPYQDLTIMDACLEAGADYIDTANSCYLRSVDILCQLFHTFHTLRKPVFRFLLRPARMWEE